MPIKRDNSKEYYYSCLLNDQFNKKYGGKKLWTL